MHLRLFRRIASWIALTALLAVTFVPTISSALSPRGDGTDICSADASDRRPPGNGHHALAHCPYCALHADLVPPLLPAGAAVAGAVRLREPPAAFLPAPRATGVWSIAQPRAPPDFA